MLAIYGYGTNTGLRAVATGQHSHSEDEIRYVRRRYLTAQSGPRHRHRDRERHLHRPAAGHLGRRVDRGRLGLHSLRRVRPEHLHGVALALRRPWGADLLACRTWLGGGALPAPDLLGIRGTRDGRRRDPARHLDERGGQLRRLARPVRDRVRHHQRLGFNLLPRIKRINKVKLYRPAAGEPDAYPALAPALTRPIRWELIAQQYDQMIKYATAIRTGTASTEAILRRFTRNATHPTYQAMLEVGRAQKTIFVARYLRTADFEHRLVGGVGGVAGEAAQDRLGGGGAGADRGGVFDHLVVLLGDQLPADRPGQRRRQGGVGGRVAGGRPVQPVSYTHLTLPTKRIV